MRLFQKAKDGGPESNATERTYTGLTAAEYRGY